ncbi:MAG: hypothetical protein IJ574_02390 [Bacilli bacterium]|nr:hypothetical protein [Bacilli bacterium]
MVTHISTRYFILIHPDKQKLIDAYNYIKYELETKYMLVLNPKKTMIVTNKEGFVFLGYRFRVINKKTIINICQKNKKNIKKKIKENAWLYKHHYISFEQAFCSMASYINNYRYGNSTYIKRLVENKWFDEFRK